MSVPVIDGYQRDHLYERSIGMACVDHDILAPNTSPRVLSLLCAILTRKDVNILHCTVPRSLDTNFHMSRRRKAVRWLYVWHPTECESRCRCRVWADLRVSYSGQRAGSNRTSVSVSPDNMREPDDMEIPALSKAGSSQHYWKRRRATRRTT